MKCKCKHLAVAPVTSPLNVKILTETHRLSLVDFLHVPKIRSTDGSTNLLIMYHRLCQDATKYIDTRLLLLYMNISKITLPFLLLYWTTVASFYQGQISANSTFFSSIYLVLIFYLQRKNHKLKMFMLVS